MLEKAKSTPKKFLNPIEEGKLSGDMRELYDRLLPSAESEDRRARFTKKLEKILNEQWPDNSIKAHVFGSSGNLLCTDESDGSCFPFCTTGNRLAHGDSGYMYNYAYEGSGASLLTCQSSS